METKSTEDSQSNSLLLVGATGWVGSEFLKAALERSLFQRIIATGRGLQHPRLTGDFEFLSWDLKQSSVVPPNTKFLVYSAGSVPQSGEDFSEDWQIEALENVLTQFFQSGGEKAFVVSSGGVYENCPMPEEGFREDQWIPSNGVTATTPYGKIKQREEVLVEDLRGKGWDIAIGRLFAGLGTLASKSSRYAFMDFLSQYETQNSVTIQSPQSLRSYIWLEDVALGVFQWFLNPPSELGTVNLVGPEPMNLSQLAQELLPNAIVEEGDAPPRHYFGNPSRMMSFSFFRDVMSGKQAVQRLKQELQL